MDNRKYSESYVAEVSEIVEFSATVRGIMIGATMVTCMWIIYDTIGIIMK